jgi:hypothetical protein
MSARRREVRSDGFDADKYERLLERGYDHMEIVDLLEPVDDEMSVYGIYDFDDQEIVSCALRHASCGTALRSAHSSSHKWR